MASDRYHSFAELILDVHEPALVQVTSEQRFEMRSTEDGAEVWRMSRICGPGGACASDARLLGWLTSRQVVDLLVALERSGIYESDERTEATDPETPLVSIALRGTAGERQLIDRAPADGFTVRCALSAIHSAIGQAQERALCWAG